MIFMMTGTHIIIIYSVLSKVVYTIYNVLFMLQVLKNLHLYWREGLFVIFGPPCAHMKCQFALILNMGNV